MPREADIVLVRDVIEQLIIDGGHRAGAARLGSAIRALPGASTAADRIEALVRTTPPVKSPAQAGTTLPLSG